MFSKFDQAKDALNLILSTNPPDELKRKINFLRTLSWDFDKKTHNRDSQALIIIKGQAKDKKGIPALRFMVSYKVLEDKTEVFD